MGIRSILAASLVLSALEALAINNFATHLPLASAVVSLLVRLSLLNFFLFSTVHILYIYPNFVSPTRHWPGTPPGNLVFGQALHIFFGRPPGEVLRRWMEEFPNQGILRIRDILGSSALLATTPATMKTVLADNVYDYQKPAKIISILRVVLGNGVILSEGDVHKFQRKHLLPSFQLSVIRDLYPVFWGKACELIYTMREDLDKPEIEFGEWCTRVTLDIIGVGIGNDFNSLKNPEDEFVRAYQTVTHPNPHTAIFFLLSLLFSAEAMLKIPFWIVPREAKRVSKFLYDFAHKLAQTRRAELNDPKLSAEEYGKRKDILSLLVKSNDFTDEELAHQILTFVAAGHETTSNTIGWAIFSLTQQPELMRALRAEIRSNLPSPQHAATEPIAAAVIDALPLLNAVCNETLRLYPVVPITMREAVKETTLAGRVLPKGTIVMLTPWGVNRNVHVWGKDAHEFVPGRWINADGKGNNTGGALSNYDFMTFLHGPRSCIGQGFAKSELKCLLATVIGRYDVELTREKDTYYPDGLVTTKAAHGMWLKFKEVPGW